MPDFFTVELVEKVTKTRRELEIVPEFLVNLRTKDLMVRGGDFYAIWNAEANEWSTSEQTAIDIVDSELKKVHQRLIASGEAAKYDRIHVKYMRRAKTGSIDAFHKFVQKQMRDIYHPLDEKIVFQNTALKKTDYASKRLPYALEKGSTEAYEEMFSTLYDPEEKAKLEWAIGAIISGDAKYIQKFEVLYGDPSSGKGTALDLIHNLFDGYDTTFSSKGLGNANNAFPLESFKDCPLVAIDNDGNLSKIEDNTRLNSLISHELMEVNAKYTKIYKARFSAFLFVASNDPVKITNAKSGILRRLIDVYPSGRRLPYKKYHQLKKQLMNELGAIAYHCLQVYKEMGDDYYEDYVPLKMMAATNDFYDFMEYNLDDLMKKDFITLSDAWQRYKEYCEFAHAFQMPYRIFRTELMAYYKNFDEIKVIDGKRVRSVYSGLKVSKFEQNVKKEPKKEEETWLIFDKEESLFDELFPDWPAQYAKEDGSPEKGWAYVKTHLADLDPHKLHWVWPVIRTFVCVDFDLRNEAGEKDFKLNLEAASEWPKTYAELSKSGGGIHLYYIYDGDVNKLSAVYGEHIEIKTFSGNASLRRLLTKCNDIPIAHIKPGFLPLKGEEKSVNWDGIKNEKMLRTMILRNLHKEYHAYTAPSIDFIKKLLDDAYESGIEYDVSDMQQAILIFAMNSSNQKDKCVKKVSEMKFKSEDKEVDQPEYERYFESLESGDDLPNVFFDIEMGRPDEATDNPGIFLIVAKEEGPDAEWIVMINPEPWEVEEFMKRMPIGFNCRKYDNHMCYGRIMGYPNKRMYELSNEMINEHRGYFGPAYNMSKVDVLDFITEKMGLKKWEIKLDIPHKEMGIPWNEPIPVDRWPELIEYCKNDVFATEAVFHARKEDFMARKIQVAIVKLLHGEDVRVCINDTTNTLSKRIIFGNNKSPQNEFNYRDLSKPVGSDQYEEYLEKFGDDYRFRVFDQDGLPQYRDYIPGEVLPEGWSILPFFPGYVFENGKSTYLGEDIGEGGRVYSVPGMYTNVWDGDVSSQHPHSIISEVLFGPRYTKVFEDIVRARVAVKHRDFETAGKLLGGALKPYLNDEDAPGLAQALKIVVNSIYGLTKAGFDNEFRDRRNVDNIVAKRGALFMTLLKQQVELKKFKVCHIKTDSIKIPGANEDIKNFVINFGREFGYEFETEGVFTKFCLLNDAAYIAKCDDGKWITKAAQFNKDKSPYTYKTLFSKEPIVFKDMCETISVNKGALYLDMNEGLEDVSYVEKGVEKLLKRHKKEGTDPEKDETLKMMQFQVSKGHNYKFVGKIGQFTPIMEGYGGGILCCIDGDKISAPGGTKGYRWLESEDIKSQGLENPIDTEYYINKVDEAIDDINAIDTTGLRGFDWLIAEDDFMNPPEPEGDFPWT